jgi:triosephosphate isomerase
MRKQIAAANWKMNLTYQEGEKLLNELIAESYNLTDDQKVVLAVPAPYLYMAQEKISGKQQMFIAAQNVYSKKSGAYTGEISVLMLTSLGIEYAIIGHSERREYFNESNQLLADKVNICLEHNITPIFCCGEPLDIREASTHNDYVSRQLDESLFHLSEDQMSKVVIAYEPIWAIGTGKTASSEQAQEMHAHIRSQIDGKYSNEIAESISILYGGSVKGSNAKEIFGKPDVDGGLVGGASLVATEFAEIIRALK